MANETSVKLITGDDITLEFLEKRPLSYSSLKAFRKSPKHYLLYLNGKYVPSDAQRLGSLVDCLALSPEKLKTDYMLISYKPTGTGSKKAWEDILEQASLNKQIVVTQEDLTKAQKCVEALEADPVSRELLANKRNVQGTWRWIDRQTKLPCLMKIDYETRCWDTDFIVDLKTGQDADPDEVGRAVLKYDYLFQTGMYLEGFYKKFFKFPKFIFQFVETSEPFNTSINFCEDKFTEQARAEVTGTLLAFKYCMDNQLFHMGYEFRLLGLNDYFALRLPPWYKRKYEGYDLIDSQPSLPE